MAVEVGLADGQVRYFLTWGRIQDRVNPDPVCALVLRAARSCSLGGEPTSARLCHTLREAAESPSAPYFYECFLSFSRAPLPPPGGYEAWRAEKASAMEKGFEISYCGRPDHPSAGPGRGEPIIG